MNYENTFPERTKLTQLCQTGSQRGLSHGKRSGGGEGTFASTEWRSELDESESAELVVAEPLFLRRNCDDYSRLATIGAIPRALTMEGRPILHLGLSSSGRPGFASIRRWAVDRLSSF